MISVAEELAGKDLARRIAYDRQPGWEQVERRPEQQERRDGGDLGEPPSRRPSLGRPRERKDNPGKGQENGRPDQRADGVIQQEEEKNGEKAESASATFRFVRMIRSANVGNNGKTAAWVAL